MLNKDIIEVEKKWAQKVVTNAKSILRRNHKDATGNLINSVRYDVSSNGSISFEYAPEGKWVESGRRKGARQPPTNPIEKWIKQNYSCPYCRNKWNITRIYSQPDIQT